MYVTATAAGTSVVDASASEARAATAFSKESSKKGTHHSACEKAREAAKRYLEAYMPAYCETNGPLEDLSRAYIDLAIKEVSPYPIDCQKAVILKFIKNSQALLKLAPQTRFKNETHGSELLCEPDTHACKMARNE